MCILSESHPILFHTSDIAIPNQKWAFGVIRRCKAIVSVSVVSFVVGWRVPTLIALKVARWQNWIPSFPWIAPGWRVGGAIQGKEGIKFCSVA